MIEFTIEILPRGLKVHEKRLSKSRIYMVGDGVKVYLRGRKGAVNKDTLRHQGLMIFQSCNIPLISVRYGASGD